MIAHWPVPAAERLQMAAAALALPGEVLVLVKVEAAGERLTAHEAAARSAEGRRLLPAAAAVGL